MRLYLLGFILLLATFATAVERDHYTPKDGFVPDAQTAERIAEAVLIPIYGEKQVSVEKPFVATLQEDRWIVRGHLEKPYTRGGIATVEIAKSDGRILRVQHGK